MIRHEITDFTPSVSCASQYASHALKVQDVLEFAEALGAAVADGLDPRARIDFDKSEAGHVVRLRAKSGGEGTKRTNPDEETP